MKRIILLATVLLSAGALAHDEGHGPKLNDSGKQGGIVSPVVDAAEASKGTKAALLYKAELVRSEDGTVRIYYYDKDMKPLDLAKLDKSGKAVLSFKKNKKWNKEEFALNQTDGAYVAKAPKALSKPFNIDVVVKEGNKELLTAFDNLD
ncbi:MAG: hypothetical protein SGJ18_02850 [Pseudomonadota bacterium]|nr:hypothetical protein [Pseudomonadota bacterium]